MGTPFLARHLNVLKPIYLQWGSYEGSILISYPKALGKIQDFYDESIRRTFMKTSMR